MEECVQMDKPLSDLIDIIHFTENVSAKIHGVLDEAEIYRTVTDEFGKSKRYNASILLLRDDGTKLKIAGTSITPRKLKGGEKASGLRLKGYKIDLNKSSIYSQVVKDGKTVQVNANDVIGEWVPRPLVQLISKIIGYENRPAILTPLKKYGRIIGVLAMSSTSLAGHFIPSVKNLAQHISNALELADEHAERKKAEEALRKSEEKHRMLLDTSPDGIAIMALDGKLLDANKSYQDMFGYTLEELKDLNYQQLTPKKWHKVEAEAIKAFMLRGYGTFEKEYIRKDGTIFPISLTGWLIKDKKGNPEKIGAFIKDITERKKAEEILKEGEQKLRDVIDTSSDAIVWVDTTGKIALVNKKGFEVTGLSEKDLVGKNFMDVKALTQESKEKILKSFMKRLQGIDTPPYEVEIVTKNGEAVPFELGASLIHEGDRIVGVQAIFRDLRERKKMEEKLRQYSEHLEELVKKRTEELSESEKRYSVLVEEASDGVAIIQDGKVVFANKKAAEIIGYSIDELIGLPFEKVVDEKYLQLAIEGYMRRMRGEKLPETAELELIAKTGERVPIEAGSTLINYQGRPSNLVIIRDIRARKRMEEERLRLEKLASVGEVATMVGHDLRNPLQSIEIAAYYLKNELPHLYPSTSTPKKVPEMLKVLSDSVNYADKIVRDLQDFSATKKLKLEKTRINTIVEKTLSQVEVPENVKLITKLGNLPKIKADKDMIKRVFLNLAMNGIQAMEKGGTLKISTKKTRGFVEVSFEDTGVGIPKEDKIKIFTPFFTRKAKGMGVGLAICKRFVDSHGGSIEVESEEGKGTTFTVELPISQENGGENQ